MLLDKDGGDAWRIAAAAQLAGLLGFRARL